MANQPDKISIKVEVDGAAAAKAQLDAVTAAKQSAAAPAAAGSAGAAAGPARDTTGGMPRITDDLLGQMAAHENNAKAIKTEAAAMDQLAAAAHGGERKLMAFGHILDSIVPGLGGVIRGIHVLREGLSGMRQVVGAATEAFGGLFRLLFNPVFAVVAAAVYTLVAAFQAWNARVEEANRLHAEFVARLREEAQAQRDLADAARDKEAALGAKVQRELRTMGANQAATGPVLDFIKQVAAKGGGTNDEAAAMVMDAIRYSRESGQPMPGVSRVAGALAAQLSPGAAGLPKVMADSELAKSNPYMFYGNLPESQRAAALRAVPARGPLRAELNEDAKSVAARMRQQRAAEAAEKAQAAELQDLRAKQDEGFFNSARRAIFGRTADENEAVEVINTAISRQSEQASFRAARDAGRGQPAPTIVITNSILFGAGIDTRRGTAPRARIEAGE